LAERIKQASVLIDGPQAIPGYCTPGNSASVRLGLQWQIPFPSNWGEYSEDQDGFMKRQRGRGRKPGGGGGGGNHGNRPFESNGPEVKIRGTAAQIYEKYVQYARDSQSAGDRVRYENYLQHAEHYFRIMVATMPRDRLLQQQEGGGMSMQGQQGGEGGQPQATDSSNVAAGGEGGGGSHADPLKVMDDQGEDDGGDYDGDEAGDDAGDRDEVEAGGQASDGDRDRDDTQNNNQNGDRQGRRRRRGRRNRPDGDRGPTNDGGNGGNGGGSALDSLARKQGALAGG
jgi:hypothetical protein